jgi:zinc transport system substrate-binding protein
MRTRIILISIAAVLGGCGGSTSQADRSEVVAAFYPLAYAAQRVGGEAVSVTNLTPPGAEPHDVELSARDVERVRAAGVVLYLGSGFQPALERAVEGASGETFDLLDGLEPRTGASEEHTADREAVDPHVWLDPVLYAEVVDRVGQALSRPEDAAALEAELVALDVEFRAGLGECERKQLVTSHAAFGHLAERYGLEQIALTGLSPEAEPSPRGLERVVEEVQEHAATTVFFETLVSPRLAQTVAREAGAKTAVLNPLEGLTPEELERGEDYFSVMRANLAALRQALGCR